MQVGPNPDPASSPSTGAVAIVVGVRPATMRGATKEEDHDVRITCTRWVATAAVAVGLAVGVAGVASAASNSSGISPPGSRHHDGAAGEPGDRRPRARRDAAHGLPRPRRSRRPHSKRSRRDGDPRRDRLGRVAVRGPPAQGGRLVRHRQGERRTSRSPQCSPGSVHVLLRARRRPTSAAAAPATRSWPLLHRRASVVPSRAAATPRTRPTRRSLSRRRSRRHACARRPARARTAPPCPRG